MLKQMIAGMALVSLMTASAEACTVMVVTKGASADGSTMVSHSNDGRGAEMNLIYVPAKDHPKGSKRPVYPTAVALNTMPEYNAFDQPNLVAPSKNLPSRVADWDSKTYPLSIRPDRKLNVEDIARIHRDYYQGTKFDKSKSPLAGLYGSPYHYVVEMGERSILSSKTSYSHISQAGDMLPSPVVWMSMDTPFENPFIPFAVSKVPEEYRALRDTYDPSKMFWASNQVMALTQGYFNIMAPTVKEAVEQAEKNSMQLVGSSSGLTKEQFADALRNNSLKIFEDWKQLSTKLLMKFKSDVGIEYEKQPKPDTPKSY